MKRVAVSVLALAISAAAGSSAFAAQDYGRYDSRYDSSDSRYDNRYDNSSTRYVSRPRGDVAQVIRVEQIGNQYGNEYGNQYGNQYASNQRQECWNERTNNYDSGYYRDSNGRLYRGNDSAAGGTLLGALIGGALGNQAGKGDGRKAATLGGAVIGGLIGNNVDRNDRLSGGNNYEQYRDNAGVVRRCRTVVSNDGYNNQSGGYNVTYRYAGQTYTAVTNYHPGRTLRVVVDVRPQEQGMTYRR